MLARADGHALVANSVALRRAGIDRNTADPTGGSILKDAGGEPTGMLIDRARTLSSGCVPPADGCGNFQALESGRGAASAWAGPNCRSPETGFTKLTSCADCMRQGRIQLRLYDAVSGPGPMPAAC